MRKIIAYIFIALTTTSFAQNKYVDGTAEEEERRAAENGLLIGKFILEPYVGIMSPSWMQNNMFVNKQQDSVSNTTYKSTGIPIVLGFKAEYMMTNKIGFGLDINYQENGINTISTQNFVDGSGNIVQQQVTNVWNEQKLRIMGRFQAHFGNPEKIDWYGGAAIGGSIILNRRDASYTQYRPNLGDYPFIISPIKLVDFSTKDIGFPIAIRGYIGARFMINQNFGILTEVGIFSGALLNVGATIRL